MKKCIVFISWTLTMFLNYDLISGHCDTMEGPVVVDARKAIEQDNISFVLKWVLPTFEDEIKYAYELTKKVRIFSSEAKELADKYFYETVVRLHLSGEGIPFTGIKPSGIPIDMKIQAADLAIETGNLAPLESLLPKKKLPELRKRFANVVKLRNFDINHVEDGRIYVEAYKKFFQFAEGKEIGNKTKHHKAKKHIIGKG